MAWHPLWHSPCSYKEELRKLSSLADEAVLAGKIHVKVCKIGRIKPQSNLLSVETLAKLKQWNWSVQEWDMAKIMVPELETSIR